MLSKAFEKSNRTRAVIFFLSMASKIVSDINTFSISVECIFLFILRVHIMSGDI